MRPTLIISALDALIASQAATHASTLLPIGVACGRCRRILSLDEWVAPCVPVLEPVPTQPMSVGPIGEEG